MSDEASKEEAGQIARDFMGKQKKTSEVDVAVVETRGDMFVVRGACSIFSGDQFWTEKFEVIVDQSGKIRSTTSKKCIR